MGSNFLFSTDFDGNLLPRTVEFETKIIENTLRLLQIRLMSTKIRTNTGTESSLSILENKEKNLKDTDQNPCEIIFAGLNDDNSIIL